MKAAAAVFIAAAAFALLATRGTVQFGSRPPSEPTIVLRAGPAATVAPTRGPGTAVRRHVEQVRIDRYGGSGRP